MSGHRWHLRNSHELNEFTEYAGIQIDVGTPLTVELVKDGRSLAQNAMFYGLYREITDAREDQTVVDTRRQCKLHYGIKILKSADLEFCRWYDSQIKDVMDYEAKLILMDHLDVTSKFSKEQGSEYINTIIQEHARQGIFISDPLKA